MTKSGSATRAEQDSSSRDASPVVDFTDRPSDQFTADLEVYKIVNEHFRQDVREFWVRSNFYLLVQAALVSVFATTANSSSAYNIAIHSVLAGLGLLVAVVWYLVARGSLEWLRRWRQQMIIVEQSVDRRRCYSAVEKFATMRPFMSPSYVTHFLPLLFCGAWILMVILFVALG